MADFWGLYRGDFVWFVCGKMYIQSTVYREQSTDDAEIQPRPCGGVGETG